MDYWWLDALTKMYSYRLSCIDESLRILEKFKCFSYIGLASEYFQVDLSLEGRRKCFLISSKGLFEPTCMSQGLYYALFTFQRVMDTILRDLNISCMLAYLDNITVFAPYANI